MKIKNTWWLLALGALSTCKEPQPALATFPKASQDSLDVPKAPLLTSATPHRVARRTGKLLNTPPIKGTYQLDVLDTFDFPAVTAEMVRALNHQLKLLELRTPRRVQHLGNVTVTPQQLRKTIQILQTWQHTKPLSIHQYLDAHQISGADHRGNVQFTGYYTPIVPVSKKPTAEHRYPIYARPPQWQGRLPSRREIEQGALQGLGLELAYARSPHDIYRMQMQGSGLVEYRNGKRELFAYSGSNRRSARPAYTFFTPRRTSPRGAGHVPLLAGLSVAVDKRYIPLGSCLLAAFPVYDHHTKQVRHEFRLFFAQDVGGRIRGRGHVDVYLGVGAKARRQAHQLNHYGRLWLLLPKAERAVVP